MIEAFSAPRNRLKTVILLGICGLSGLAAGIAGIDDNPPGILLAFVAAIAFVLAFVHPWRIAKQFRSLLFASMIGIAISVVLNNLFALVAHDPSTAEALQFPMQGLAVTAFIFATLICPAAFIIGAVGWVVMYIRGRRKPI